MRPENLDKLIEHLQAQPSHDLDRRIDALLNSRPGITPTDSRTRAIRGCIAKLAIAAAVILAVVVGIPLFNGDGSNVWAQALENTRKITNYTFRLTRTEKSSDPGQPGEIVQTDDTWYVSAQRGLYIEHHAVGEYDYSNVFYELPDSNEWIKVYSATQEYERGPRASSFGFEMPEGLPKEAVLSLLGSDYVELGTKTVGGRVLMGVRNSRIPDGASEDVAQWNNELWFDRDTMLLASREHSVLYKGSGTWHVTKQDRFQYNVEFPSHVSNPKIPEGYAPTIVNGLRLFSELSDGVYPPWSLGLSDLHQKFGGRAGVEKAIEKLSTPVAKYGYDSLTRAADFFHGVVQASPEFAYYGDRVTATDANQVLMYWGDPCRPCEVVWGDLHMETLSREQLIESCRAAGDHRCLVDLLEKSGSAQIPLLAACLGEIGDLSSIPALLRHADLQQDTSIADVFRNAVEAIRLREEQRNPSSAVVWGRLFYANGRSVSHGCVHIGTARASADRDGYFVMMAPCGDPLVEQVGYAHRTLGANARLFRWAQAGAPAYLTITLDWTCTVTGRVVNQAGDPLAGVHVGLCPHPGETAGQNWPDGNRTKTDAQGHFLFEDVAVGLPLNLVVENPDKAEGSFCVRIDDLAADQRRDLGDIRVE